MTITIILIALTIVCIVADCKINNGADQFFGLGALILLFLLTISLLTLVSTRIQTPARIASFESVKNTVERARMKDENFEIAAIQMQIVEANKWLASTQYWRGTIFRDFLPSSIDRLEPIE